MMSDKRIDPQGWVKINVETASSEIISGSGFSKEHQGESTGDYPFAKVGDISRVFRSKQKFISSANHFISEKIRNEIKARVFPKGAIVFPKIGEALKGNYRVVTNREMLFDNNVMGIIPDTKLISGDFFYYFLTTQDFGRYAVATAVPSVRRGDIASISISLPPLSEQHRIVAKIEELFSELDKGIENLKTAQAQLKVYRQALLKHAFEGKLTAQWRAERHAKQSVAPAKAGAQPLNDMDSRPTPSRGLALRGNDEVGDGNDKPLESADTLLKRIQQERAQRYQQQLADWEASGKQGNKPKPPKSLPPLTAEELAELPELPEGWGWVRVGEIAEVQLGRQRSPDNRSNKFPTKYIRAGNLTDNGLNLDDVLDMEFEPQERARFLLKAGDVLLSEASGSAHQVGKPAVWRSEIEECCFQNTIIRVRSLDELSEYLFWVFKTYYISGVFSKLSGGVGINHLSAGKLESMAIPLVAIAESKKVLELINEKLSLIENLDQTITTALQQAEALRQSILKKAFSGQLVPQDPNDEPASELLARIKAERADNGSRNTNQRRTKKVSA